MRSDLDQPSIDILDWFSTFQGCRWDGIKKKLPWNEDVPLSRTKAILKSKDKDAIQDLPLMLKCCISELHRFMKRSQMLISILKQPICLKIWATMKVSCLSALYTDLMFDLFNITGKTSTHLRRAAHSWRHV